MNSFEKLKRSDFFVSSVRNLRVICIRHLRINLILSVTTSIALVVELWMSETC